MDGRGSNDLTICIASLNTRIATELCLRSLLATTDKRFIIRVGDCSSTDGSREFLRELARQGVIELEVADRGRRHGEWIDHWRRTTTTRWILLVDSDVEFQGRGWLEAMRSTAVSSNAALVTAGWCDFSTYYSPAIDHTFPVAARPEAYLLLLDHRATADITESFSSSKREKVMYDTAAAFAEEVERRGGGIQVMPADFGAYLIHYGGLSWRMNKGRLPRGRRDRSIEKLKFRALQVHLRRRRRFWRKQMPAWRRPNEESRLLGSPPS